MRSMGPVEMVRAAPSLNPQTTAHRAGNLGQTVKHPFGGGPSEHLRLVVHARIPILDVQRVKIHDGVRLLKSKPDKQALRPTIAGTEGKIPDAIEDGAATVDFEGLNDMRVMADHHIGAALHGEAGFSLDLL